MLLSERRKEKKQQKRTSVVWKIQPMDIGKVLEPSRTPMGRKDCRSLEMAAVPWDHLNLSVFYHLESRRGGEVGCLRH